MTKRMIIVLLALAVVFGAIFGFKAFVNTKMGEFFDTFQPPPATVATTQAEAATWQPSIPAVGTLRANNGVALTAEVAGVIEAIEFDSGQRVSAGTVLFRLDTDTDKADLAALQATRALAQADLKRQQELYQRRSVSKASLDSATAEARRVGAQIERQQAQIRKKTIRAPFDGELGIREADLGEYVAPGTPLVSLQSLSPILVDFSLPEQRLTDVSIGQRLDLRVDAFPDQTFTGTVTAIAPLITAATRTVAVQASLPNAERQLRPGMFARVSVALPQRNAVITLPRTAIVFNPYGDSVYLVTDEPPKQPGSDASADTAGEGSAGPQAQSGGEQSNAPPPKFVKRAFVKLGGSRGDQVAVLEGVAAGDEVVTAGQLKLRNGSRVVIDNARTPANAANPQPENK